MFFLLEVLFQLMIEIVIPINFRFGDKKLVIKYTFLTKNFSSRINRLAIILDTPVISSRNFKTFGYSLGLSNLLQLNNLSHLCGSFFIKEDSSIVQKESAIFMIQKNSKFPQFTENFKKGTLRTQHSLRIKLQKVIV